MSQLALERDVALPLRDGVITRCDVWRSPGSPPQPAVLVRTPYMKEKPFHLSPIDARLAADRGYVLVIQDVRGRGGSGGDFMAFLQERDDGYDSVQWVAEQPWCNGDIVMSGISYFGATQWLAAEAAPPALKAIAPLNSSDAVGEGWSFYNGVREQGLLASWIAASLAPAGNLRPDQVETIVVDPARIADVMPDVMHWFSTPPDDPYWDNCSVRPHREQVVVPAFIVGGWYDCFARGTLASYLGTKTPADRLLMGPWSHDNWFGHLVGEQNLGYDGSGDAIQLGAQILDFFDDVRAGRTSAQPPVQVFVLGAKRWWSLSQWPPPDAVEISVPIGTGSIAVDPTDLPSPTGGRAMLVGFPGSAWGPRDYRHLAARSDVLVLPATFPQQRGILAGPAVLRLSVSATGGDERQWVAILCVQEPGGSLMVVTEGVALAPTGAMSVEIPLGDICLQVGSGRALVVLVAGGCVPRWEPVACDGLQHVHEGSSLSLLTASFDAVEPSENGPSYDDVRLAASGERNNL